MALVFSLCVCVCVCVCVAVHACVCVPNFLLSILFQRKRIVVKYVNGAYVCMCVFVYVRVSRTALLFLRSYLQPLFLHCFGFAVLNVCVCLCVRSCKQHQQQLLLLLLLLLLLSFLLLLFPDQVF